MSDIELKVESENKKNLKDIVKIILSNMITLLSGIVVGFVIPKILGIEDYGYYKTFTLYCTYAGLFHFGFCDGIYLLYGDKNYDQLEKSKFRFYSKFILIMELVISLSIALITMLFFTSESRFIFLCLSLFVVFQNIKNYFEIISQITRGFSILSFNKILTSLLTILVVLTLYLLYKFNGLNNISYKIYTFLTLVILFLIDIIYCFLYKEIVFGKSTKFSEEKENIKKIFKCGIVLLIANLASVLLFTVDRQFVNIFFDNSTFAIYSFAYTMLNLVTVLTAAISTVIYPIFKRKSGDRIDKFYNYFKSIILILVFLSICSYFPLVYIIRYFLPDYVESLSVFKVIFPGLAMYSCVTIVMNNYYKISMRNWDYFFKNIIVLTVSIAANFAAYYIWGTVISISIASIFVLFLRYYLLGYYFDKLYKTKWYIDTIYIVLLMSSFYLNTLFANLWIGFGVYIISFVLISYLLYAKLIKIVFRKINFASKSMKK